MKTLGERMDHFVISSNYYIIFYYDTLLAAGKKG
jgi:hypothetical protein